MSTWRLNVTEKNAPQMEANTAIMEDAPAMKLFSSCCTWSRSRQPKWNGSCKTSKLCILPGFHSPVMQKTLQIPVFLTRWTEGGLNARPQGYKPPGGGDKSDSVNKSAFPAPGIFLAKARGTPASIASFRDKDGKQGFLRSSHSHHLVPPSQAPVIFSVALTEC